MRPRKKTILFIRRFFLRGLILIPLLGIITFVGMLIPKPTSDQQYMMSKHYNGRSFVNEDGKIDYSAFWDFLRWQTYEFKKKWPSKVPNIYEPHLPAAIEKDEVYVTFINHATLLIQTQDLNILTDPVFSKRVSPFKWLGPKRVHPPGLAFKKLPPIDLVLVSHNHYDHLDFGYLKKLSKRFNPQIIVPLGDRHWLKERGVKNVSEMDWWTSLKVKDSKVYFLPAKHNSGRSLVSENSSLWGAFWIQTHTQQNIFFAGDTAYSEHFKKIYEKMGAPDLSFLPIGAYLPRAILKDVHMNPNDALLAHKDLHSKRSMAMHFGTFQLSDESYWDPLIDLNKGRVIHKIAEEAFLLPAAGRTFKFKISPK